MKRWSRLTTLTPSMTPSMSARAARSGTDIHLSNTAGNIDIPFLLKKQDSN
jgi:hypothetical protein